MPTVDGFVWYQSLGYVRDEDRQAISGTWAWCAQNPHTFSQREITHGNLGSSSDLPADGPLLTRASARIFHRTVVAVPIYAILRLSYKHLQG